MGQNDVLRGCHGERVIFDIKLCDIAGDSDVQIILHVYIAVDGD
jgi:hypothetical protein